MAFDFGDALDLLRGLADWPSGGSGKHGPARRRVGRWTGRTIVAVAGLTAVAMFVTWLKSENFAGFDRNGLPVLSLGLMALFAVIVVHCVAAIIANIMDRRADRRRSVRQAD
ncbi:hypothetical protein [Methylopila sp. M107]|uniref:hypothetical protein n=1 Tax=Methylopila sp. M107 TaxID=1101190 RepID=UPI00036E6058|nr:hypothetical protein [Methylopila sp. M107]